MFVDVPSSPQALYPNVHTVPSAFNTIEWDPPAAIVGFVPAGLPDARAAVPAFACHTPVKAQSARSHIQRTGAFTSDLSPTSAPIATVSTADAYPTWRRVVEI